MRRALWLLSVPAFLLGTSAVVRAGDQPTPQQIVEKAIKAHGGAKALAKFKAATFKAKGTTFVMGLDIPFTGEFSVQAPAQMRVSLQITVMGKDFKFVEVVNRDKGWRIIPGKDKTEKMTKDQLAEALEEMHAEFITELYPLRDKAYKLSLLGEAQVDSKPALGVRVEHKGHRPVNLYFDKKSHLLVKSEYTVKDEQAGDNEIMQEVFYKDHKSFDGTQKPTRIHTNRDGKRFNELELIELEAQERLDDGVFSEP